MKIKDIAKEIHNNAVDKGFWESFNLPEKLMLIVSEVAEAMEADRESKRTGVSIGQVNEWKDDDDFKRSFIKNVKGTVEDELADTVIRVLDLSGGMRFDIEQHIKAKMRYNAMREHKHGKKY